MNKYERSLVILLSCAYANLDNNEKKLGVTQQELNEAMKCIDELVRKERENEKNLL